MIVYSDKIIKALNMAYEAHKDQKDKIGVPYIFHPYNVASRLIDELFKDNKITYAEIENIAIIAILHDIIEDSDMYTIDDIKDEFGDDVADAIDALTRGKKEKYEDYIARVCSNKYAVKVKVQDIKDNLCVNRMNMITNNKEKDRLVKKYYRALAELVKYEKM